MSSFFENFSLTGSDRCNGERPSILCWFFLACIVSTGFLLAKHLLDVETKLWRNRTWKTRLAWEAFNVLIWLFNVFIIATHCMNCNGLEGLAIGVCVNMIAQAFATLVFPQAMFDDVHAAEEALKAEMKASGHEE